jgi:hypothetical protein
MATWFAFQGGYDTIQLAGAQEKQAVILGFHGYATKAEAEAKRNSVNIIQAGPLNLLEADYKSALSTDSQPGGKNSDLTDPKSILNIATSPFNVNVTQWFVRIGEVALGIVLIAVGLAKLTGVQNTIAKVAKVATKV